MALFGGMTSSGLDTYETARWTLDLILDKLDPVKHHLWEPFRGSGRSTWYMRSRGFEVVNGDNEDFFEQSLPIASDGKVLVLVSNPPFSIKAKIMEHIHQLGVQRWALLLPVQSMFTLYFGNNTDLDQLAIIFHGLRPEFLDPETGQGVGGRASFDVCWFAMGVFPGGTFTMGQFTTRTMSTEQVNIEGFEG